MDTNEDAAAENRRRQRATTCHRAKLLDTYVNCSLCNSTLKVRMPPEGGREFVCPGCDQVLFVLNRRIVNGAETRADTNDGVTYSCGVAGNRNITSAIELVLPAVMQSPLTAPRLPSVTCTATGRREAAEGRENERCNAAKRAKGFHNTAHFGQSVGGALLLKLPSHVTGDCILIWLDMCTLSRLDLTCTHLRKPVEVITISHAKALRLSLRCCERWSNLRLAVHATWTMNGVCTGASATGSLSERCIAGYHAPSILYTCGDDMYGQLGMGGEVIDAYYVPCKALSLGEERVCSAWAGGRHTCIVTERGEPQSFGNGRFGQLGTGLIPPQFEPESADDVELTPCLREPATPIVLATAAAMTTAAMGMGEVREEGERGARIDLGTCLKHVDWFAAGFDHTIALRRDGAVYAFGREKYGRLGFSTQTRSNAYHAQNVQTVVTGDIAHCQAKAAAGVTFASAAAGLAHTALLTNTGELYTCGLSVNGRLGHGSVAAVHATGCGGVVTPPPPPFSSDIEYCQMVPRRVENMTGIRLIQAALGSYHTVLLCSKGHVYTCGYGTSGQLGSGDDADILAPQLISSLVFKGDPVVQVCAGHEHTAVLTLSGKVFTFGLGENGQLGHGSRYNWYTPKMVDEFFALGSRVVQIAAASNHTIARLADGRVASFGSNDVGQLGHGNEENAYVPRVMEAMKGDFVRHISAGGSHVVMLVRPAAHQYDHV